MMKPTDDKCTYTSIDVRAKTPPSIVFSSISIMWIRALVDHHSEEIGFFGVVDEVPPSTYRIRDIFYPKHQLITSGTCEISPEGEAQIVNWLCEHGRVGDLSKLRMWGHSHHTMGVFASHQDEQQALERMRQNQSYLIRAIVNKDGKMDVAFFDYERQIKFEHVPWTIESPTDAETQMVMDEKLSIVASILAGVKTASEKLDEIDKIIKKDPIADNIKEKVLRLKTLNAPPPSTTVNTVVGNTNHYQYGQYAGGFGRDFEGYPDNEPWNSNQTVIVGGQQRMTARQSYEGIVDRHMKGGRGKKGRSKNDGMIQRFTERFQGR